MIDPKKTTDFLCKHGISFEQFFFMYLIYLQDWESLYKYTETNNKLTQADILELIEKGFLINNSEKEVIFADQFIVTTKFTDAFFTYAWNAAIEFWNLYPPKIWVKDRYMPTKGVDKDDFCQEYTRKVGRYKHKHQQVMEALEYAIKHDMINMGIQKWIASEQYEEVLAEMNQKVSDADELPAANEFN